MVLMLRHMGIPTRLAGGYAPGTLDTRSGSFIVKEYSPNTKKQSNIGVYPRTPNLIADR